MRRWRGRAAAGPRPPSTSTDAPGCDRSRRCVGVPVLAVHEHGALPASRRCARHADLAEHAPRGPRSRRRRCDRQTSVPTTSPTSASAPAAPATRPRATSRPVRSAVEEEAASRARTRPGRRCRATPKVGRNASATSSATPSDEQRQAAVVDGSTCSAVRASSRQMPPATPGRTDAGMGELDVEPEQTRHHQQVGDVRIGEHVRARAARAASGSTTRAWPSVQRRGEVQRPASRRRRRPCGPSPALQQLVEVARDEVDDLELRRLVGRRATRSRAPPSPPTRRCDRAAGRSTR